MLSIIKLNFVILNVIMLSVIVLIVIMHSVIRLNAIIVSVIMLSVIMLSVIMPSDVAPQNCAVFASCFFSKIICFSFHQKYSIWPDDTLVCHTILNDLMYYQLTVRLLVFHLIQ
jgi:hypothetical protein